MKLFAAPFALVSLVLATGGLAHADTIYTATGNAHGYVCSEGGPADCAHAEQAAQGAALNQCYAAGNNNCWVESVTDTEYGGACGPSYSNDYCNAAVAVRGN